MKHFNKHPELLLELCNEQYYKLSFWKDSDSQINYRRFFTVNGLICLNVQHETVFAEYHSFIKKLLDKGIFQGLRVDHIDGLFDPETYLHRLRELTGQDTFIVVEKILESGEQFPASWPVQGNTGYDFLASVNNLLTSTKSKKAFTDFYKALIKDGKPVHKAILEKKRDILYQSMAGELENLYHQLISLNITAIKRIRKLQPDQLKSTIANFLIRCPVYRYYGNSFPPGKEEVSAVANIFAEIGETKPALAPAAKLLNRLFTRPASNNEDGAAILKFYQRCMQFTGPLMAKGVEDTLMYTYDRFIGHNEVGDSPNEFGMNINSFHEQMTARGQRWPLSINATATHDTKRGEDVRAKLNVLTDLPDNWFDVVGKWQSQNAGFKTDGAPETNDEYLIYQTITGSYSFEKNQDDLNERLPQYLTKALREAKTNTQWAEPDEQYEKATLLFAEKLLDTRSAFWKGLTDFQARIADGFVINALTQVLLKFTCPGIPDVYQGCERWDFSMVDPDNRRPVDYKIRQTQLNSNAKITIQQLWDDRTDGRLKLWLTQKLFAERRSSPELFTTGDYIPIKVNGVYKNHVIAFARKHQRNWLLVIAPLHTVQLPAADLTRFDWGDTTIVLPDSAPLKWIAGLTGEKLIFNRDVKMSVLLNQLPMGIFRSAESNNRRGAGIIMHITSLPSHYGIGDMGPEARKMANFLAASDQSYWQLLPLNPTDAANQYSPYSTFSSMAGNVQLISLDDLLSEGYLTVDELTGYISSQSGQVDYEGASLVKDALFKHAFIRFKATAVKAVKTEFTRFKKVQAYWLTDFALFDVLKTQHNEKPWYNWALPLKHRDQETLNQIKRDHKDEIEQSKWLQFIFFRQWQALKTYGNNLGIRFIGDLPFYVSYNSVDVWANPGIFKLDASKHMKAVAGVPPDYFNANGQLWGMPVYNWATLKASKYKWWLDRFKRNSEFFDLIRLDHFRAFYDYWEVPEGEATALNGQWRSGPGAELFNLFLKMTGSLPFIAEDLGDIHDGIYKLRDALHLPGMNVLQYAFGEDMPVSVHIPHNHIPNSITYTGTHDNNTLKGWFIENCTEADKMRMQSYLNAKVGLKNVNQLLIELCYASVSKIAILPLQDVLAFDGSSRMNVPASAHGNWLWRIQEGMLGVQVSHKLGALVKKYNR